MSLLSRLEGQIEDLLDERHSLIAEVRRLRETLTWIYHGHTDDVQNVRDVAKRSLDAGWKP